jgi:hypothetical protein
MSALKTWDRLSVSASLCQRSNPSVLTRWPKSGLRWLETFSISQRLCLLNSSNKRYSHCTMSSQWILKSALGKLALMQWQRSPRYHQLTNKQHSSLRSTIDSLKTNTLDLLEELPSKILVHLLLLSKTEMISTLKLLTFTLTQQRRAQTKTCVITLPLTSPHSCWSSVPMSGLDSSRCTTS